MPRLFSNLYNPCVFGYDKDEYEYSSKKDNG
jgi:hypothetical protein